MKKFTISVFLAMAMFLFGCSFNLGVPIQIDPQDQAVIAKIAGRHAGAELAKENPEIAQKVVDLCEKLLATEENEVVKITVDQIIGVLINETIDDPLLVMDIQDIIGMIQIKADIAITPEHLGIVRSVAKGLISGIERRK